MYKLQVPLKMAEKEFPSEIVIRLSDMASIPMVNDNTDYQAYLAWVAEGGVPTPADEVTQ
jgi:hypothetical protein